MDAKGGLFFPAFLVVVVVFDLVVVVVVVFPVVVVFVLGGGRTLTTSTPLSVAAIPAVSFFDCFRTVCGFGCWDRFLLEEKKG